jgi:CRISPR-associated protein Cas1
MQDLHELPRLRDSLSYLYVEHAIIEQQAKAVELIDKRGRTLIPAANLTVLFLGPGTSITHAAVKSLADNGCGVVWVGEDVTRFYAHGTGETRRAYHLLHQARLVSNPDLRLEVCKRMYRYRFGDEPLEPGLTIQQLRGMEGARVRTAYAQASLRYGVEWHGRRYKRGSWGDTDPINRALSTANALLNGLCHAAIVSGGYSPALGFIHTGKQRSFVYDIADLYKVEVTIPVAFRVTGKTTRGLRSRVRRACRDAFKEHRLLKRILRDIDEILDVPEDVLQAGKAADTDPARPEPLWTPKKDMQEKRTPSVLPAVKTQPPSSSDERTAASEAEVEAEDEPEREEALRQRRQRALRGLDSNWTIRQQAPDTWSVVTNSGPPGYTVCHQENDTWTCTCPDFANTNLGACKHTLAVEIIQTTPEGEPWSS